MKKNNVMLLLFLYLVTCGLVNLFCADFSFVKKSFLLKDASDSYLTDLVKFKFNYSKDGTVLLIAYDSPAVKIGEAEKIGLQLSMELKNYLMYWLNYWNVKLKFIKLYGVEESGVGENNRDYVKIIITDMDVLKGTDEYNKIYLIFDRLRGKDGIEVSKIGRYIKIDLNVLFDNGSVDLRLSSSFILDSLIDILKLSNNNLGLKIETHKRSVFTYGNKNKEIIAWGHTIAVGLQSKGLKDNDMYLFPKEDPHIIDKKIDIVFFNNKMKIKNLQENMLNYEKMQIGNDDFIANTTNYFYIYKNFNDVSNNFYPTGWVGDSVDIFCDFNYKDIVNLGEKNNTCIQCIYKPTGSNGWSGVQWQYPPNNWGNKKIGFDLRKFKKLIFYARGLTGKEKVSEFKIGGVHGKYSDSDVAWIGNIQLSEDWKKYEILLENKNLENIICGFSFILTKYDNRYGCTIYLDDIHFEY